MRELINQGKITQRTEPSWASQFSKREYDYLIHVINGMLTHSELDELLVQFGKRGYVRALHIYEPFVVLNNLGYLSPSVVTIAFDRSDRIHFLTGGDNGLGIFDKDVIPECSREFPRNCTGEIAFWHFVDAIGKTESEWA